MTSNWKRRITLALCDIVRSAIYKLLYLRGTYYDAIQQATGTTNAEFGFLMTARGLVNFLLYLPSSWAADKFSARKLMAFSLISTGINGFYYVTFPSYTMICLLHAFQTVTTIFTFWAVCVQIIRTLGTSKEQGRLYGYWFLDKGLTSIILGFFSVPVFAKFGGGVDSLRATIIFYSVVTILADVLTWFVCQDETHSEGEANLRLADMAFVLKTPTVWLAGVVIFCMWSIHIGFGMVTSYLAQILHMGESEVTVTSILRAYVLFVMGGLIGRRLTDRCASHTRFMIYASIDMIVFTTVCFFLPGESHYVTITLADIIALDVFIYSANAVSSSIIGEVRIPAKVTGAAVGLISLLTHFPKIYCYTMVDNTVDRKPDIIGYQDVFLFMLVCAPIGLIVALVLQRVNRKSKNQVNEITESNADCVP